jgi:DtxR family Mn-dependent transcriptional regulator
VQLLGMELHRAHIEAHRLEHGMSREFEARLTECLGHPTKSPFGRPIPGTGQPKAPPNALTLDRATLNANYVVERVPEEDDKLLKFLAEAGLTPAHQVTVLEATPYLGVLSVATEKDRVSIGYNVAEQIMVLPAASATPE